MLARASPHPKITLKKICIMKLTSRSYGAMKQINEGNGFKHRLFGDVKHPALLAKSDSQIAHDVLHIFVACGCQR